MGNGLKAPRERPEKKESSHGSKKEGSYAQQDPQVRWQDLPQERRHPSPEEHRQEGCCERSCQEEVGARDEDQGWLQRLHPRLIQVGLLQRPLRGPGATFRALADHQRGLACIR